MKRNNNGFTLAEMLIVVAIIGVLISIATISISNSLEKAREATDLANIRSAYSKAVYAALEGTASEKVSGKDRFTTVKTYNDGGNTMYQILVHVTQKQKGWQTGDLSILGLTTISFSNKNQSENFYNVEYNATKDKPRVRWYSTIK